MSVAGFAFVVEMTITTWVLTTNPDPAAIGNFDNEMQKSFFDRSLGFESSMAKHLLAVGANDIHFSGCASIRL